jgi:MFS family permease
MINYLKKLPFYYGWVLVGISFLTLAVSYGSRASFSVFLVAIQDMQGWSRGAISAGFTLHMLVALIGLPLVGAVVDRCGPRGVLSAGIAIMAAGVWMLGGLKEIWHFYLSFGLVMATGRIMLSMVPHTAIISNWFVKRRGTAMGVTGAGIGIGSILMVPLVQFCLTHFGWRSGCTFIAVLIVLVLLPFNMFLQRLRPSDIGLLPDGSKKDEAPERDSNRSGEGAAGNAWTVRRAVSKVRFWLLYFVFFLGAMNFMVDMHQIALFQDAGLQRGAAVSIFAAVGLLQSTGVFFGGAISDRIGREKALTLGICLQITGILTLMRIHDASPGAKLPFFILCYGFGNGFRTSILPSVTADLFPGKRIGSVYGLLASAITVSAAFGPWFAGHLFDLTGTYRSVLWIVAGCLAMSGVLLWLVAPRKHASRVIGV